MTVYEKAFEVWPLAIGASIFITCALLVILGATYGVLLFPNDWLVLSVVGVAALVAGYALYKPQKTKAESGEYLTYDGQSEEE